MVMPAKIASGQLDHSVRPIQALHFERVVLAEVDRLGDFGFGFDPALAGFIAQPGVELETAQAQQAGRLPRHADALGGRRAAPFREICQRGFHRPVGQRRGRLMVNANGLAGSGGVQRGQQVASGNALAGQPQLIFASEFGADFGERVFHGAPVFGQGKIGERFVAESSRNSSSHHPSMVQPPPAIAVTIGLPADCGLGGFPGEAT
jgi:hypothetical protein